MRGSGGPMSERLGAALLFGLVALVFLCQGLPSGVAPVCVDPLYADGPVVPYEEVRPADFEPHNPYLSDHALVFYPWLKFMSEAVRGGELPLWSPHSGGGVPFIGNLSSAFWFPLTWLCFLPDDVLSVSRGMLWGGVLRLFLAGFFGFLFLRRIGLCRAAALTGGLGLMLFGYQVVWLFYSLSNVACLIPLCLYLTQRFLERPDPLRGMLLASGMAVQFLGGHAETSLALALCTSAWLMVHLREGQGEYPARTLLVRYALVGVVALLLCSFQLFPFVEYLFLSQGRYERLAARPPTREVLETFSAGGLGYCVIALLLLWFSLSRLIRARDRRGLSAGWIGLLAGIGTAVALALLSQLGLRPQLLLVLEPDLFGSPLGDGYRGPETYTDVNGGYAGALLFLLALLYLLSGPRRVLAAWFGGLLALAWVLPGRVEPFHGLLKLVPPFDLAADTRMLPLSGVAIAVLGACALDELLRDGARRFRGGLQRLAGFAAGVLAGSFLIGPHVPVMHDSAQTERVDEVVLLAPEKDAVFSPAIDARRRGHLIVPLLVQVPAGTSRVRVGAGDGYAVTVSTDPGVLAAGGQVDLEWWASRQEAGIYRLEVETRTADADWAPGPTRLIEIDRQPRFTLFGLIRIGLVVLLLFWLTTTGRQALLARAIPGVVVAGELFLFGMPYNAFVPEEQVFPRTATTDFLRAEQERRRGDPESAEGPFRFLAENLLLQPNSHYAYGLHTPRSYDQLENRRFNQLMRSMVSANASFDRYNHTTIDYAGPLFSLLNVEYILTVDDLSKVAGLELVHTSGRGRIYQNHNALPRAWLVGEAIDMDAHSDEQLRGFDPRTTAMLEVSPPAKLGGKGTARVVRHDLNRVEVEVESDGDALLILADNHFPGWQARVDGKPTEILRSHLSFRAVQVPPGASRVEFDYQPASVRWGVILASAALLLGGVVLVISWLRANRSRVDL